MRNTPQLFNILFWKFSHSVLFRVENHGRRNLVWKARLWRKTSGKVLNLKKFYISENGLAVFSCLLKYFGIAPLRFMIGLRNSCHPLENHSIHLYLVPVTCISLVFSWKGSTDNVRYESKAVTRLRRLLTCFCRVVFECHSIWFLLALPH